MKSIIENKAWNYCLEKRSDGYFFSVVCGTIGLYEVTVVLSSEQINRYNEEGSDFLDRLSEEIRKNNK